MFQRLTVKIKGVAPLFMHNSRLVDPQDPFTRELGRLTKGKTKKTEEGQNTISLVEWCGGLYHTEGQVEIGDGIVLWDKKMRVVIPAANLHACIIDGAKAAKLGKVVKAGVIVPEDAMLDYDGPKDLNALMSDVRFISRKPVGIRGQRVIRTRPIFRAWGATFDVEYNQEVIDEDQLWEAVIQAGRTCGMGDWKPQHGRFEVVQ